MDKCCRHCGEPNLLLGPLCEECLSEIRYQQLSEYEAERENSADAAWNRRVFGDSGEYATDYQGNVGNWD